MGTYIYIYIGRVLGSQTIYVIMRAKDVNMTHRITIRMPDADYAELLLRAKQTTISKYIRGLINEDITAALNAEAETEDEEHYETEEDY